MTQVIGRPFEAAQMLGKETLTQKQAQDARSIGNTYRLALGRLSQYEHVTLYMGKIEKKILSTDLMKILRDCRERLDKENAYSPSDYAFFANTLRKVGGMQRQPWVSMSKLMRLRRLAYAEHASAPADPVPAQTRPPSSGKISAGRIRRMVSASKNGRARSAKSAPISGCRHQDPGSGVRCGAECSGPYCDTHRNLTPRYNGRGSKFHALGLKEAGDKS